MCINEKWLNSFTLTLHINSSVMCNTHTSITVGKVMCSQRSALFSAKPILTPSLSAHVKRLQQFKFDVMIFTSCVDPPKRQVGFGGGCIDPSPGSVFQLRFGGDLNI